MGGDNPVRLQSMTNTSVTDVKSTVRQAIRIFEAGADYVRLAIPDSNSARFLPAIRKSLQESGFRNPLIADIHYQPELALQVAPLVEKIRINPGNYTDRPKNIRGKWNDAAYSQDIEKLRNKLIPLIAMCKEYGTAIRIGTNMGSLSERITYRYGHTPEAMVQSTIELLGIFEELSFYKTVVSLKASNPLIMIQANRLMAERMLETGMNYPIHLGVTEAGSGMDGRIKSALGIGSLLKTGIGDTVRVSLTEDPENEIPVAAKIVDYARFSHQNTTSAREDSLEGSSMTNKKYITDSLENLMVMATVDFGDSLLFKKIDDIHIEAPNIHDAIQLENMKDALMQATGRRISRTEFIACPSCARTSFDIQKVLHDLQQQLGNLPGLKIAVMGCVVNGPGEMADADFGLMGGAKGLLWLYKGKQLIKKNIDPAFAADELLQAIQDSEK